MVSPNWDEQQATSGEFPKIRGLGFRGLGFRGLGV